MEPGKPSSTARATAAHRAVHQIVEGGRIFSDPLAIRIMGEDVASLVRNSARHPAARSMRLFVAMRARCAEDALERALRAGVRQVVVLGAGLDTFAYRLALTDELEVFEVDHPATQAWKRERLEAAQIVPSYAMHYVSIDFDRETLGTKLHDAGFDADQPAFFTWLGVVPYLEQPSIWATLRWIASLPGGAEVIFDYSDPPDSLAPEERAVHDARAAQVARLGEAWISHFDAQDLELQLHAAGFLEVEDVGPSEMISRYLKMGNPVVPRRGGHVVRASNRRASRA